MIAGVLDRQRLLMLIRDFTVFGDWARHRQDHRRLITSSMQPSAPSPRRCARCRVCRRWGRCGKAHCATACLTPPRIRPATAGIGVIWHTQGSGKSFLMAFYAGLLVREPALEKPTIVVITDRNDLDRSMFATFSMCSDLIRQTPIQNDSREDLIERLDRASGGVIFTTMQKFAPPPGISGYHAISDRRNVIVIADEAHRSQYGFRRADRPQDR